MNFLLQLHHFSESPFFKTRDLYYENVTNINDDHLVLQ